MKDHFETQLSPQEVSDKLTASGLEVEGVETIESIKGGLEGLVVGHVVECGKHPNADKLSVTKVDIGGDELLDIVCGAPNVGKGQKVVVAPVNSMVHPKGHEPFKIKKAKIRGEKSEGMICAEDEIGLGDSHDGILVLDESAVIGMPAKQLFDVQSETVFEIGLTPNRADAASHRGVARDLRALFNQPLIEKEIPQIKASSTDLPFEIKIENEEACPRYCGVTIKNVKVESSPTWLSKKLESIGLSPVNNVVDITNFILHDLGQPLHAFDYDKIENGKVVIKTLPQGTKFITLDGEERELNDHDLMICDDSKPMCIAGVFGGLESGVSEQTTNVFLESAYFSADYIRKTSIKHGLKTDASFRFERGTDPNLPFDALKFAAQLICEVTGGEIAAEPIDINPTKASNFEVNLKWSYLNKLTGKEIEKSEVKQILKNLDIVVEDETDEVIQLSVPPYRVDVTRPADIVEEVLRIHGFDQIIESDFLGASYLAPTTYGNYEKMRSGISQLLAGNGFFEIMTNSLGKPDETLAENIAQDQYVEVLNKLSEELAVMRQSLLFNGLSVIAHNINRQQKNLKLFEFGKTYHLIKGNYVEKESLALYITGSKEEENWKSSSTSSTLHDLNEVLYKVGQKVGETISLEKGEGNYTIKMGEGTCGIVYKLSKAKLKPFDIKQDVYYASFDMKKLLKKFKESFKSTEISKFPTVRRDLSLVIDKAVKFSDIVKIANKTNKQLIKEINLFDVYEGDKIDRNKKAYAVSFNLLDTEKTLTDKDIDKLMTALISNYEKELSAVIRK